MAVVIEGPRSVFLTDRAILLDDAHDVAWAEKYIQPNPMYKWVLGKFVEADNANSNHQYWSYDNLRFAKPSITHAPMNLLHQQHHIVGAFVGTDFIHPTDEASQAVNSYIEALGVFWKYYFPDELKVVEAAYSEGSLFYSMECLSKSVTCGGDNGCGSEFAYMGPTHESYCAHINGRTSNKEFNEPHFLGGALIIPPVKPGWSNANVKDLSDLTKEYMTQQEMAYEGIKQEYSDLNPVAWEQLMNILMAHAYGECNMNAK